MTAAKSTRIETATNDVSRLRAQALRLCDDLAVRANKPSGDPGLVAIALQGFAKGGLLELPFLAPDAKGFDPHGTRCAAKVVEVLAGRSGTLASIYMVNAILGGALIALMGTPGQKSTLLPGLRGGRLQLAFAMTEPTAGSDAASLATTARRTDSGFTLRGEKIYTTGAATTDWLVVVARPAEQVQDKRALTVFLVPGKAKGLTVEPLEQLSNTAHASCRINFHDVAIERDAVLGGPSAIGSAWATLRSAGALERLIVSAMALGLAGAIVERATDFARSREQFGQPIAKFQSIQHVLVEMRTSETAMRLFVENALSALERLGSSAAEIPMAKYFCSEQLQNIANLGMRVMGGRGFFRFEEMERYYREAPFSLFAGGTVEIQKMLIARAMGLP